MQIIVEIKGKEIKLTVDEARALYSELENIFGNPISVSYPWEWVPGQVIYTSTDPDDPPADAP